MGFAYNVLSGQFDLVGGSSTSGLANRSLSNLTSPTAINQDLIPNANNSISLGSTVYGFKDLFLSGTITNLSAATAPISVIDLGTGGVVLSGSTSGSLTLSSTGIVYSGPAGTLQASSTASTGLSYAGAGGSLHVDSTRFTAATAVGTVSVTSTQAQVSNAQGNLNIASGVVSLNPAGGGIVSVGPSGFTANTSSFGSLTVDSAGFGTTGSFGTITLSATSGLNISGAKVGSTSGGSFVATPTGFAWNSSFGTVSLSSTGVLLSSATSATNITLDPGGSGYVDASTSLISNVVDPVSNQDAATKNYIDTNLGSYLKKDGSVALTGSLLPSVDNTIALGSAAKTYTNVWTQAVGSGGSGTLFISSGSGAIGVNSGTGVVFFNNNRLASLSDPSSAQDAATKAYVDNAINGLFWEAPVQAIATSNVALTGSTPLVIDGYTTSNTDRIILKGQTTASQNKVYTVSSAGGTYTLFAVSPAAVVGDAYLVLNGTVFAETGFVYSAANTFTQFASVTTYTAGSGLQLIGTQFSVELEASNPTLQVSASQLGVKINGSGGLSTSASGLGIAGFVATDIPLTSFSAAASQTNASVTGLAFANASVRAFNAIVSVVTSAGLYENFQLNGIQRASDWQMSYNSVGDSSGYTFTINTSGQVLYSSPAATATVKFRATVTTV